MGRMPGGYGGQTCPTRVDRATGIASARRSCRALRFRAMHPTESLEQEVAERALRTGVLSRDNRVLVAVSGGKDSAATAALLCAASLHGLPLSIVLGHVDHGWRGHEEAEADLACVWRLGAMLGVEVVRAGPPAEVRRTEDAARRHRYGALERMAAEHGCGLIATGHHLRDQAETYVMRLRRGSGPAGLAGIPVRRLLYDVGVEVVRPVLWVPPRRLAEYVAARGLPYRDDPTNFHLDRDRAKIRAELTALGDRAESEERVLAEAADGFAKALVRREDEARARLSTSLFHDVEAWYVEVAASDFAALGDAEFSTGLRVLGGPLRAAIAGPWFTRRHAALVGALARSKRATGAVALPERIVAARHGKTLSLARTHCPAAPEFEITPVSHVRRSFDWVKLDVRWNEVDRSEFDLDAWRCERRRDGRAPPHHAALDAQLLGARARIRLATPLDRSMPWGADGWEWAMNFAQRNGVPARRNGGLRVVEAADGGIAWIVGVRTDARYAITDSTERVALLEVHTRTAAVRVVVGRGDPDGGDALIKPTCR